MDLPIVPGKLFVKMHKQVNRIYFLILRSNSNNENGKTNKNFSNPLKLLILL